MKIAFLGDFVLTDSDKIPKSYFDSLKGYFSKNDMKLCINLESPIVDESMKRVKEKLTLKSKQEDIKKLCDFAPYLINLANNHINDYGNESVQLTREVLEKNEINYFGVGYKSENNRIYKNDEQKFIFVAYCSRSSDFTGSKLFAEDDFMGVWEVNLEEITKLKQEYSDYSLIVNVHWGMEDIVYPEPEKRVLGKKIIDAGADLVMGHHPHIIQPVEVYKGKYIFYSIGNFFFPEIEFELRGEVKIEPVLPHQKEGIIPIIKIEKGSISLEDVISVKNETDRQVIKFNSERKFLKKINSDFGYSLSYKFQNFSFFCQRVVSFLSSPQRIKRRIKLIVSKG